MTALAQSYNQPLYEKAVQLKAQRHRRQRDAVRRYAVHE